MLGISTCWWQDRMPGGGDIISQALAMGFAGLELDYRITRPAYERMKRAWKRSLPVLSVHNIFPVPEEPGIEPGIADHFLLSSLDPEERALAVKYAVGSIQEAHEVEARAVVFHLGKVDMEDPTPRLVGFYESGKGMETEEIRAFVEGQRRTRREKRQKNLDAVLFSLDRLNKEAEKYGVLLGVENRYHFHEIPDPEEIGLILDLFRGGSLRYWHDIGHASVLETLGVLKQKELLRKYQHEMIGIHIHDAKGIEDHLAPGEGEVDFGEISSFLTQGQIKVLEVHPKVDEGRLREGVSVLGQAGIS